MQSIHHQNFTVIPVAGSKDTDGRTYCGLFMSPVDLTLGMTWKVIFLEDLDPDQQSIAVQNAHEHGISLELEADYFEQIQTYMREFTYVISYQLNRIEGGVPVPEKFVAIPEIIKGLGPARKISSSIFTATWIVQSVLSSSEIRRRITRQMQPADQLLIVHSTELQYQGFETNL